MATLAAHNPTRFAAVVPICGGGLRFFGFPESPGAERRTDLGDPRR